MEDTLVRYETAELLKEKGFQVPTLHFYLDKVLQEPYAGNGSSTDTDFRVDLDDLFENHNRKHITGNFISTPTQSLAQKWLREIHHIDIHVICTLDQMYSDNKKHVCARNYESYVFTKNSGTDPVFTTEIDGHDFYSYEDALEVSIIKSLKLIKNNKENGN